MRNNESVREDKLLTEEWVGMGSGAASARALSSANWLRKLWVACKTLGSRGR